ncbi:MAG: hypothetical protein Q9N26_08140 [Aquificota bacterium]|nr:hypothetical protein [Aquificota bacterium]
MIVDSKKLRELLGVSKPTVTKWVKEGCPHMRLGDTEGSPLRFVFEEVVEWLRVETEGEEEGDGVDKL